MILWPVNYALHYVGFTVLEARIVAGVRGGFHGDDAVIQQRFLDQTIHDHCKWVGRLEETATIAFNGPEDWDERRRLRPTAAVLSPFIRHRAEWGSS